MKKKIVREKQIIKEPMPYIEQALTTASTLNPLGKKEEPSTWYTEKDRISIAHVKIPHDPDTEYVMTVQKQDNTILTATLIMVVLFLIGVVL